MGHTVRWMCAAVGALGTLVGCGSSPTTSTVKGTIAQETFSPRVHKITVVNDKGNSSVASVDASGAFSLVLAKHARYQFFLSEDGKSMPIVIKSDDGRLETALEVKGGGATADMGSVRFWPGTQIASGRQINVSQPGPVTTIGGGACVSGKIEGTDQPCASGEATLVCEDVDDEDSDDEEDGDNHECEDGIDPNGNYCDGGPAANQDNGEQGAEATDVSSADAIGVPELNLPESLGCGGEDDEEEGDDD